MRKILLNNSVEMPVLGFGVFQIEDLAECERSVRDAIDVGYRLIDTAASYGNEEAVGNAIRVSDVPRSELFVTTKLWIADTGFEKTKRAFDRSLKRLQLDYLDLFHPDRVMDFMVHNEVAPAVDQIETHPFHQQVETQKFLTENNIQIESWGPFAEGKNNIFRNEVLVSIAEKHGKTVAQVILRWLTQRDIIVIPKSVRRERMAENFDIFNFELTQEEMNAIRQLDTGTSLFFDHRDPAMVKLLSEAKRNT